MPSLPGPRRPRLAARVRALLIATLALISLAPGAALAGRNESAEAKDGREHHRPHLAADPLVPLIGRIDRYFRQHRVEGVTMDARYAYDPHEAIRMSVVCQLLGYAELFKSRPTSRIRRAVTGEADFLVAHLDDVRSHGPFDGMLGCSLLDAYEATGDARYLEAGGIVVDELMTIPTRECILNGGLMVALATAKRYVLTGDVLAGQKTRDILTLLPPFQNQDGSFPHWCRGSEDIHYTGWMAMELVTLDRIMPDARIEPILDRMGGFLDARVDSAGLSHYEGPCPDYPGCMRYYDSRRTGCGIDYDTRGWTVEPAYSAQLFDHLHSPKYLPTMRELISHERGGTFADKWEFLPPPDDAEYFWSIADTSVANMSINFWVLATILSGRPHAGSGGDEIADDDDDAERSDPESGDTRTIQFPSGARDHWRTVDSLFIAGADPGQCGLSVDSRAAALGGPTPSGKSLEPGAGGSAPASSTVSAGVGLLAVVPNPATAGCDLRFAIPASSLITLGIYDVTGRLVRLLDRAQYAAGEHALSWDLRDETGRASPGGAYFARLQVGSKRRTIRFAITR